MALVVALDTLLVLAFRGGWVHLILLFPLLIILQFLFVFHCLNILAVIEFYFLLNKSVLGRNQLDFMLGVRRR